MPLFLRKNPMSATTRSSDLLAASTLVATGKNYLNGLIAGADGTNAATVTIYDNTAASGKVLMKLVVKAGNTAEIAFPTRGIHAENGIYVAISGTGASALAYFGAS